MCLDIFKHEASYVAKEITEWVETCIYCYIPDRKFHLKPHSSPLHIATIISIYTIGMRLLKIRSCFVILVITVRESSKRRGHAETTRGSVASQLMRACMRACMRTCMRTCIRACMRACMRAELHVSWRL